MTAEDIKQQLQLPGVGQIGVVVEDIDRAIAFYESTFGIGPWDIREVGAPNVWDRGEEKFIKARLAFADIGQVEIELIQILEGDSLHLAFLREHGEGLHHLGFFVKDFAAKLEQAQAMGLKVLQKDPFGQAYAYLDTRQPGGIIFELIAPLGDQNISMLRGMMPG
ncbi:MAG: VOC family protein [Dehalococcoidia bacterium]|nr:MAG: VOC family protein [Dehalococcoidia bacterium]